MRKIKITKMSDEKFDGQHPNNINEGYTVDGSILKNPVINEPFCVIREGGMFVTSKVTEIIDSETFKTLNSTYKWEVIN